jgi:hypothetical protein
MVEGMLVQLAGQVSSSDSTTSFFLDDGSGAVKVYVDPDTGIHRPDSAAGQHACVVGVVSQYYRSEDPDDPGYRVMPRYPSDLIVEEPSPALIFPLRLPETGGWQDPF